MIKLLKQELIDAKKAYNSRWMDDPEVKAIHAKLVRAVKLMRAEGATISEICQAYGSKDRRTIMRLLDQEEG